MNVFKRISISIVIICMSFNYSVASNFIFASSEISDIQTVATPVFEFESKAQILMDIDSGYTIYASNANEKIFPASVTKVMTMLLIMENIDSGKLNYTDIVTCSKKASGIGGSQIWFKEGEQLSVNDCLKAISVVSANDVCVAMAEHIAGSEENFVNMMNEKAKELSMINTNFVNPHGLDDVNHYTTAYDISLMSRELMLKHPDILNYTTIWMDSLRDGSFELTNTNKLIRFYDGATGLKTGSTSIARFNLAATATKNNTNLLAVVCTAPTSDIRTREVTNLLDYGFSNFESETIRDKGELIGEIFIDKSNIDFVNYYTKEKVSQLKSKGSKAKYDEKIVFKDELIAPIKKDTVIGNIEIYNEETNEKTNDIELILNKDVEKANYKYYFLKLFDIFQ